MLQKFSRFLKSELFYYFTNLNYFPIKMFDSLTNILIKTSHRYDTVLIFINIWNVNGFMGLTNFFLFPTKSSSLWQVLWCKTVLRYDVVFLNLFGFLKSELCYLSHLSELYYLNSNKNSSLNNFVKTSGWDDTDNFYEYLKWKRT